MSITGSGLKLIKVACFFLKMTADQLQGFRLDRGLKSFSSLGNKESAHKGKISAQITLWHIVDSSDKPVFLLQSSLRKSDILHIVISTIFIRLVGCSFLQLTGKNTC